jgi:tyrosyl-tRNA synthetase
MKLSEELKWRGFVNQTTFKDLSQLDTTKRTLYFGVDPSADSMQVGNLAAAMMIFHFMNHGYKVVLLVGGATGMVGDPKDNEERALKPLKEIAKNKAVIASQYRQVFAGKPFKIVDNYDWFKKIGYLDFLRDIGKHMSMTQLLDREFVQSRIGKDGIGLSYAEFSYSLIQGYDFLHLFRKHGVSLQICGADQWGNSVTGVDLIRKLEGAEAHVYSCPLIMNKATGRKFGKSESGTIWLNPKKTSVFDFYQFWLNSDDAGVEDYLKIFTLLGKKELEDVMAKFKKNPAGRFAQKTLAYEVTKLVHGQREADQAAKATEELFSGQAVSDAMPAVNIAVGKHEVVDLLVETGLAESKTAARRLMEQGGVKLNQKRIDSQVVDVAKGDVLQVGKRRFIKIG